MVFCAILWIEARRTDGGLSKDADLDISTCVGVVISPDGVYALVADRNNHLIRLIIISATTPSVFPSPAPSVSPTSLPSVPLVTRFSFGVKIGDEAILNHGKAILVEYLQDPRRGQTLPHFLSSPGLTLFQGR
jgi:hypothetical protein